MEFFSKIVSDFWLSTIFLITYILPIFQGFQCVSGIISNFQCAKSVQMWSFFWSVSSCFRTAYRYLLRKARYSVQIQEIRTRKNSVFGYSSRGVTLENLFIYSKLFEDSNISLSLFNVNL